MLKLFDRYILKELTPPFFIGLMVYTFVLLMNQILLLSELFIARGVAFGVVAKLLVFLIPSVLAFTVPMSVLMGILAGLSRMSSDAEITALKTLGVSDTRLLRPVALFSLCGFLVTLALTMVLAPRANFVWVQTLSRSVLSGLQFKIQPREFNESIPNTVLFIQDITPELEWKNIFAHLSTSPERPRVILARRGRMNFFPREKRATLELFDGTVHSYPLRDPEDYRVTFFRRYEEELDVESLYPVVSEKKKVREKDIQELWRDARAIKEELGALPASEKMKLSYRQRERELTSHWVEIHKKLALPFSCIIFALLGLPLGAFTKKGGRTSGFTLSIGIILLYYILITAGEQLAMEGRMSAFIGMWGPNVLFLALGLYFFVLSVRETSFRAFWTQLGRRARWFAIPPRARTRGGMPRVSPPFPNILDRYVLRKYLAIFGLVFVSLLAVYAIVTFFERIDRLYENEKPLRLLLSFIWFKIPEFVHTILPVSALAATLLSLGLLTKFNEVTAMKACGISLYRLTLPVLLMGGVVSVAAFSLQENVMPYSNKRAEHVWNEITNVPARSTSYLDRRWVLGRNKSRIYHYRYFDSLSSTFSQISVYDIDPESWLLRRRFFGVKGVLQNGELTLSDAWSREFLEETKAQFEKRASMTLSPVEESRYFLREWKEPDQMSYAELRKYIRDIQERGFETTRFRVDLNVKLSFPIASLLMALLGIPFAFWMGKRGTLVGIGLSVAIAMVYWGGLGVFRSLGYVQALGPVLAAWGPNLIFGGVGLILLSTLRT